MDRKAPGSIREYLRTTDNELADRADNFWKIAKPILDRQNYPNSNENGQPHAEKVEHNAWRLIKGARKINDFNPYELFILSCGACSHDFDKGLFLKNDERLEHGKGSGAFLLKEYKSLQKNFPEVVAISKIIGIHDLSNYRFQEELKKVDKIYPLSSESVKLQKLAVVLKAADILHTDNSRIAPYGTDISIMTKKEKNKHLARESISGWRIDGERIIFNAVPETVEHLNALDGCKKYIKKEEWPAVEEKLSDYDFPYRIDFNIDSSTYSISSKLQKKQSDSPQETDDKNDDSFNGYSTDPFDNFNPGRDLGSLALEIYDNLEPYADMLQWFRKTICQRINEEKWVNEVIVYFFGSASKPILEINKFPRDIDICIILTGRNRPEKIRSPLLGKYRSDTGKLLIDGIFTELFHLQDYLLQGDPFYHSIVTGIRWVGDQNLDNLLKKMAYKTIVPRENYLTFLENRANASSISLQTQSTDTNRAKLSRIAHIASCAQAELFIAKSLPNNHFNHKNFISFSDYTNYIDSLPIKAKQYFLDILGYYKSRSEEVKLSYLQQQLIRLIKELKNG